MQSRKNVAVCLAVVLAFTGVASAQANDSVADALKHRYKVSEIEVQNAAVQGAVARPGVRLRIEADGVPAKPFHTTQANTKSPRFHARDYARVEVASGKFMTLDTGDLKLPKGTEVVVLNIKAQGNTVRLFTHTVEPIARVSRRPAFGCTEFVFRFEAPLAEVGVARVQQTIDGWLTPAS